MNRTGPQPRGGATPAVPATLADRAVQPYDRMLMRRIMHAFYWLDDGLQAHLARTTGVSVPRAQSMIMVCIGDGVQRQADLATRLGVSKQAVQQALKELVGKGLVTVEQDPDNGRQRIVRFTARGRRLREVAVEGLLDLEALLEQRIGRARLDALQDALAVDWGPLPESG
ncbi:MAG: MarR family transcriptional regulator [Pseudomonadales bacterium]|nr:MarR family transcriptional regulator [Pseudomonadales bacterium]